MLLESARTAPRRGREQSNRASFSGSSEDIFFHPPLAFAMAGVGAVKATLYPRRSHTSDNSAKPKGLGPRDFSSRPQGRLFPVSARAKSLTGFMLALIASYLIEIPTTPPPVLIRLRRADPHPWRSLPSIASISRSFIAVILSINS